MTLVGGGSRGDVQPVVALARGIAAVGHDVTVAASVDSEHLVTSHGLAFHPFDVSIAAQMRTDAGRAWVTDSAGRPFRELRHMRRAWAETAAPLAEALLTLTGTADVFVSSILSLDSVAAIAEHDGARHVTALLSPFHPTADGRAGLVATVPRTHPANTVRSRTARWVLARNVTLTGRIVRERLGLPETGPQGFIRALDTVTAALGVSPQLVPTPDEWPPSVTVTGPWSLPAPSGWQPPADLTAFLADGVPPVYVGFGSMSVVQPGHIRDLVVRAARAAGVRLLLSGTDLQGRESHDVMGISDVPHAWLFPRVRAAVHHGGAGTTHAALLAGVPQLAVPHIADQPYWGRRIQETGLGPKPLSLHKLTADRLTERLQTLLRVESFTTRARTAGLRARAEDGVRTAVRTLGLDR